MDRSLDHKDSISKQKDAFSIAKVFRSVPGQLLSELLHHSIDYLSLSWNPKATKELFHGCQEVNRLVGPVELLDVLRQDGLVEVLFSSQVLSNLSGGKGRILLEELGDALDVLDLRLFLEVAVLNKILESILWLLVELFGSSGHDLLVNKVLHLDLGVHSLDTSLSGERSVVLLLKGSLLSSLGELCLSGLLQFNGGVYSPVEVADDLDQDL